MGAGSEEVWRVPLRSPDHLRSHCRGVRWRHQPRGDHRVHRRGRQRPCGRQLQPGRSSAGGGQRGRLRGGRGGHKAGEKSPPAHYTIKDDAVYTIVVKELVKGQWVPYDGKDMQMEFVRIDPFVRVTMENKAGHMIAKFKVPDTYGVYQFKVNYNRVGLSRLSTADQISVIPLRHDKYERFIGQAYPYYASAFSMMAGVFVFSLVFLHYKEDDVVKKTQ